jgi:hypothetical protein
MSYNAVEFLERLFRPAAGPPAAPPVGPDDLPPDWRDWFGERLAIMAEQCDGPAPDHLRVIALADTLDAMRRAGEWPIPHRRF